MKGTHCKPLSCLTENQKGFIGKSFTIWNSGVVSIVGKLEEGEHYVCECSICSKDSELFPFGTITTKKYDIEKGKVPCGCSNKYKYKRWQYLVKLKRACEEREYTLNKLYKNTKGRYLVDITCNITGVNKENMGLSHFLAGRNLKERSVRDMTGSPKLSDKKQICNIVSKFPKYKGLSIEREAFNRWNIECNICKDDEISNLDSSLSTFKASTVQMRQGVNICRCDRPLNRKEQTAIIIKTLEEEGGRFIGWTDIVTGNSPMFRFIDSAGHDNLISYGNFKAGKRCKKCANNYMSDLKSYSLDHWRGVVENNPEYPEGTDLVALDKDIRSVYLYCPVCAVDIFTLNGLCGGIFKTSTYFLEGGVKPCRCNKSHPLNKEQQTFLIESKLKEDGKTFLGWENEYVNKRSNFSLSCHNGSVHTISAASYLTFGYRCKCCGEREGGFDSSKPANFYIVRWYNDETSCIKIGITNRDTIKRLKEQYNVSEKLNFELLYNFYHEDGNKIKTLERHCKDTLEIGVVPKKFLPDGYTETIKDTPENIKHVLCLVDEYLT